MNARIEYSQICRRYFVTVENGPTQPGLTRKDDAETLARKLGATEIEHATRPLTKTLRDLGFAPDSAREIAKVYR